MGIVLFIIGCIQGRLNRRFYGIPLAAAYLISVFSAALIYFMPEAVPQYETVKMIAAPWLEAEQTIAAMLFQAFLFYFLGLLFYSLGYSLTSKKKD